MIEDKEFVAIKLGFESTEEMEKYYDLCRGNFKDGIIMTKELCTKHITENGFGDLLNAPREESVQQLKSLIDFELSELNKCYEVKEQKTL